MTIAVLADVHANLEALDAVLRDIDARAPGARLVCCGDVVGYGPDPAACIARLLARGALCVRGNHEEMVLGARDDGACVAAGVLAAAWTRRTLHDDALAAMNAWPSLRSFGEIVACHGSPRDSAEYLSSPERAARALADARAYRRGMRLLVCGHTHAPVLFSASRGAVRPAESAILSRDEPWLLNPGSVGQARDGTTLARYALVDDDVRTVTFCSVAYDHETTIAKERAAGLVPSVVLDAPRTAVERQLARGSAAAARVVVRLGADVLFQRARQGGRT